MARSVGRIALALALTLLALAIVAVLARVWLAQQVAEYALAEFGLRRANLTVTRVGFREFEVRDVSIGVADGPGVGAAGVTVHLAWSADAPVAVTRVEVDRGYVRGVLQDGRVTFGSLDSFIHGDETGGDGEGDGAMPDLTGLPEIAVRGLRLRLDGPAGTAEIGLGEEIVLADGLLEGSTPIHILGPGVSGEGRLTGRARSGEHASLSLSLDALAIEPPWLPVPVRLTAFALNADVQPGFATAELALRAPELGVDADLSASAAPPFHRPPVDVSGRLVVESIAALRPLLPSLPVSDGRLRLAATLSVSVDTATALAASAAALRSAEGRLDFDLGAGVSGAGPAGRLDIVTAGHATLRDNRLRITFDNLQGSAAGLDRSLVPAALSEDGMAPIVGREAEFTLTPGFLVTTDDAAELLGNRRAGAKFGFAGELTFSSLADIGARIGAGEGTLDGLRLRDATLSAANVQLLGNRVETLTFDGDAAVSPDAAAATGRLHIAAPAFAHENVAVRGIEAEFFLDGRVGQAIDIALTQPGRIAVRSLAVDGLGATTRPLDLRLAKATVRQRACLGGECPDDDPSIALSATLGGLGWRTEVDGRELAVGRTSVQWGAAGHGLPARGRLELHARDITAAGLARVDEVHAAGPVDLGRQGFDLGVDVAGLLADPALAGTMPAIGFRGQLAGDLRQVRLKGEARAAGLDQLRLAVDASHLVEASRGEGRVELAPVDLATLPAILEAFGRGDADRGAMWGELAASANLRWSDRVDGDAVVTLASAGIRREGLSVGGADLRLSLSNLLPPQSDGSQRLTIRRIDAGVPIDAIETEFRLTDDGGPVAVIENMTGELMGGRFSLRPLRLTTVDPGTQRLDFDLHGIDLGELAEIIAIEGVELDGEVSGHLPVAIRDASQIAMPGARLSGDGPGVIRLSSATAREALAGRGGEQLDLVLRALENYHFQALDVAIDKAFDGEADMRIGLKGNNPAVQEGRPIHLNVSVTGNADRLLETILTVYRASSGAVQRSVEALR